MEFDFSRLGKWMAAMIGAFLLIGFGLGSFMQFSIRTNMACHCSPGFSDQRSSGNGSQGYHEQPCNRVDTTDFYFFTVLVNIYEEKEGTEILECRESERTGMHVEYDNTSPLKLSVLGLGEYELE